MTDGKHVDEMTDEEFNNRFKISKDEKKEMKKSMDALDHSLKTRYNVFCPQCGYMTNQRLIILVNEIWLECSACNNHGFLPEYEE